MRVRGATAAAVVALMMAIGLVGLRPASAAFTVHKVDSARFTVAPDKPVFILVMGNDGRPGDTITRGDALHLVGVNPGQGKATILDIPRDTFVPIPDQGSGRDKINAAHAIGGPALEARAVGSLVGVDVPFVVDTDFQGFTDMVNDLGGVDVDVPFAMDDPLSGAIFDKGVKHMDGGDALAFARNRHIDGGDFTRTGHQGDLLLAGLTKLRGEGAGATSVLGDMAVLARHARLDGLSLGDAYRLGRLAVSIDPANVRNVVMPGAGGTAGAASVVFVDPGAASLFDDFRDDAILESH
ncbi:MAG: polyisoprenyl-teichoic acid--peptidoglycan teichoic acid transferase [Acidimicrobiaceae bacterium]